jgi:hypothetical protein
MPRSVPESGLVLNLEEPKISGREIPQGNPIRWLAGFRIKTENLLFYFLKTM